MVNKKTVLIVEDDVDLRSALSEKIRKNNFFVIESDNGKDGLRLSLEKKPDLIILDLILPKMTGEAMLEELRNDEWGKDVPVIALTNVSSMDIMGDVLDNKVDQYLIKSNWKLEEIIDKIKKELVDNN